MSLFFNPDWTRHATLFAAGHGHLVVATATQCCIYSLVSLNTPHILDMKEVPVLILHADRSVSQQCMLHALSSLACHCFTAQAWVLAQLYTQHSQDSTALLSAAHLESSHHGQSALDAAFECVESGTAAAGVEVQNEPYRATDACFRLLTSPAAAHITFASHERIRCCLQVFPACVPVQGHASHDL